MTEAIDEAVWSMTDEEYAIWLESQRLNSPHTAVCGQSTPQLVVSNRILGDNTDVCVIASSNKTPSDLETTI